MAVILLNQTYLLFQLRETERACNFENYEEGSPLVVPRK
jgi:hypothetical protein